MSRDYDTFENFIKDNDQSISATFAQDLLSKLELPLNLMRLEAMDFLTGVNQYRKQIYVKEITESVVWIRKDVDKGMLKMINFTPPDDDEEGD